MMLSTRLFPVFLTLIIVLTSTDLADARTIQKKGRNYWETAKRVEIEADLQLIKTSLTLRLLNQMKTSIYARLLENAPLDRSYRSFREL